jgi:hypothetical protein
MMLGNKTIALLIGILVMPPACVAVRYILPGSPTRAPDPDLELRKLRSLPYLSVSDTPASANSNVILHDPGKAYRGFNLYASRSSPEAYLMDMGGEIVHRWSFPPEHPLGPYDHGIWNHVTMLENGDLVVISKYRELLRIDWNSELIWRKKIPAHHDVAQGRDGSFYVIVWDFRVYRGLGVGFPGFVQLTSEGEGIGYWLAYEHLDEIRNAFDQENFLDRVLDNQGWRQTFVTFVRRVKTSILEPAEQYRYFHMNTIDILPDTPLGRTDRRFRKGNLLICFRNINQLAILDGRTKKILWTWGEGVLERPHHPTMLGNGHILVFDNGVDRKYSRVFELDPATETIVWEYVADPPKSFYSFQKGSAQRLPNGNTLICEGDEGRAFEVTSTGETVWTWLNPFKEEGHRGQVYRMTRYRPEQVEMLLSRPFGS